MSAHLQIDLDDLHRHLLSMCAKVEDLIHRAVAQLSNEKKISLTELARLSAKRVNRLRPLFQWEAMTPNEIKTLVEGQIHSASAELQSK